ncbi:MAG: metallophosphoesterase [Phycisphaerae bacterium]
MPELRLLIITDVHYEPQPPHEVDESTRLAAEWVRRAVEDAKMRGGFDAVVLLGDLVNEASLPAELAGEVAGEARDGAGDKPVFVIPGNHDPSLVKLQDIISTGTRIETLNGYRLVLLTDRYESQRECTRPRKNLELIEDLRSDDDRPAIALQHNPVHPPIDSDYPYLPTNRSAIMAGYEQAGVLLSISGHYHEGQPLTECKGVRYLTCPSLTDPPYRYTLVHLRDEQIEVDVRQISVPSDLPIIDAHCHTEFAYCGHDITAETEIDRARRMGLTAIVLAEHAPQLYCTDEDFWNVRHIRRPELWRNGHGERMAEFRQSAERMRDGHDNVWIGLEVELDIDGQLTLREDDRRWADVILGAVHWLWTPFREIDDKTFHEEFRRINEGLVGAGIDILAHPFRRYPASRMDVPEEMPAFLAELLAEYGVAAEINFHNHPPYRPFFEECLKREVKFSFATDAHYCWEAGGLAAGVAFLQELAGTADIADLLWRPHQPTRSG